MLRKHEWQRENEFGSALWMIQHRIESDRLRLVAFLLPRVRTRTSLYIRTLGEQNLPFTDGKQIADAFGVKWRSRDDRCLNTYKPAGHRQYQKLMLQFNLSDATEGPIHL